MSGSNKPNRDTLPWVDLNEPRMVEMDKTYAGIIVTILVMLFLAFLFAYAYGAFNVDTLPLEAA